MPFVHITWLPKTCRNAATRKEVADAVIKVRELDPRMTRGRMFCLPVLPAPVCVWIGFAPLRETRTDFCYLTSTTQCYLTGHGVGKERRY
jgi:hypothetical protein